MTPEQVEALVTAAHPCLQMLIGVVEGGPEGRAQYLNDEFQAICTYLAKAGVVFNPLNREHRVLLAACWLGPASKPPPVDLMQDLLAVFEAHSVPGQAFRHSRLVDLVWAFGCGWRRTCALNGYGNAWYQRWPDAIMSLTFPFATSVHVLLERLSTHWYIFKPLAPIFGNDFELNGDEIRQLSQQLAAAVVREFSPVVFEVPAQAHLLVSSRMTVEAEIPTRLEFGLSPARPALARHPGYIASRQQFDALWATLAPAATGARAVWRLSFHGTLVADGVELKTDGANEVDLTIVVGPSHSEVRIDCRTVNASGLVELKRILLPAARGEAVNHRKLRSSPLGEPPHLDISMLLSAERLQLRERECSCGTPECRNRHSLAAFDPRVSSLRRFVERALWPTRFDGEITPKKLARTLFGAYLARSGVAIRRPEMGQPDWWHIRFLVVERECIECACGRRYFGPLGDDLQCECNRDLDLNAGRAQARAHPHGPPMAMTPDHEFPIRTFEDSMIPIGVNVFHVEERWNCRTCLKLKVALLPAVGHVGVHDSVKIHSFLADEDALCPRCVCRTRRSQRPTGRYVDEHPYVPGIDA